MAPRTRATSVRAGAPCVVVIARAHDRRVSPQYRSRPCTIRPTSCSEEAKPMARRYACRRALASRVATVGETHSRLASCHQTQVHAIASILRGGLPQLRNEHLHRPQPMQRGCCWYVCSWNTDYLAPPADVLVLSRAVQVLFGSGNLNFALPTYVPAWNGESVAAGQVRRGIKPTRDLSIDHKGSWLTLPHSTRQRANNEVVVPRFSWSFSLSGPHLAVIQRSKAQIKADDHAFSLF